MILPVARLQLASRVWGAEDLSALAAFWRALCRRAAGVRSSEWEPEWALELRVGGFPRFAARTVREALAPRAGSAPGQAVTALDADTFVVLWDPLDRDTREPFALGLPLLTVPALDGLVVEIRFALVADSRPLPSTTERGHTLVVLGEVRGQTLFVRALWAGPADASEFGLRSPPTPWEPELFARFDRFRETNAIARQLTDALGFAPPQQNAPLDRLLFAPFGRPRWFGLLVRCAALALTPAVVLFLLYLAPDNPPWLRSPIACLALLWLAALVLFVRGEAAFLFSYAETRAGNDRLYRRSARYVRVEPEDAAVRLDDPIVRKYTAELMHAGFVHAGDAAVRPVDRADLVYRIFRAPDGATVLALLCVTTFSTDTGRGAYWPALVSFECQTFFPDGGLVDSVNHDDFTTYAPRPSARRLAFPAATNPLELFQAHAAAVEAFAREVSATPLRHEPFDRYLCRQDDLSREECAGYARMPYSWEAHLRWYLQLDARPPADAD